MISMSKRRTFWLLLLPGLLELGSGIVRAKNFLTLQKHLSRDDWFQYQMPSPVFFQAVAVPSSESF